MKIQSGFHKTSLWLLGMTVLLLPLTPSFVGIPGMDFLAGRERMIMMIALSLGWWSLVFFSQRIHLNTSVVLGSFLLGAVFFGHAFLFSPFEISPLLWEWIFFLAFFPVLHSLVRVWRLSAIVMVLVVLALQAQWAVIQFSWQSDLGFNFIGESSIHPDVPGVAKFSLVDHKVVRAYGPYSHPNALGAALLFGLILLGLLPLVARSYWTISLGGLMTLGIILSFSRSAIVGLALWLFLLSGTVFGMNKKSQLVGICLVMTVCLTPLLWLRSSDDDSVAWLERVQGVSYALTMFAEQPFVGSGVGSYPDRLSLWAATNEVALEDWQVTYVHMVPLLTLLELGVLLGGALLIAITFYLLRRPLLVGLLLPLLPGFLLDHYFYTYSIMWLLLGYLVLTAGIMARSFRH